MERRARGAERKAQGTGRGAQGPGRKAQHMLASPHSYLPKIPQQDAVAAAHALRFLGISPLRDIKHYFRNIFALIRRRKIVVDGELIRIGNNLQVMGPAVF